LQTKKPASYDLYQNSFQLPHINRFLLDFYALKNTTIACASAKDMATRGRLCNDFSPLQTFDKLNLFIRHLKTKLVLYKNKNSSSLEYR
jgi:hypothetical protein